MIDFGLSDEYLQGFNARLKNIPYDNEQSEEWRMGWVNANQSLKSKNINQNVNVTEHNYFSI